MTPKGHRVIRGHCDLLCDLCGLFDLVYDPQKVTGSLEVALTYMYLMTPKATVNVVVSFT